MSNNEHQRRCDMFFTHGPCKKASGSTSGFRTACPNIWLGGYVVAVESGSSKRFCFAPSWPRLATCCRSIFAAWMSFGNGVAPRSTINASQKRVIMSTLSHSASVMWEAMSHPRSRCVALFSNLRSCSCHGYCRRYYMRKTDPLIPGIRVCRPHIEIHAHISTGRPSSERGLQCRCLSFDASSPS